MSASRILYLVESPLDERDADRHGVRFMAAQGFDVSVLDVADLTFPQGNHKRDHYATMEGIGIHHVRDRAMLRRFDALAASADLIITFVGISHITDRNLPVHRFVSRSGRPTLCQFCNPFPGWERYRDEGILSRARMRDIIGRLANIRPIDSLLARIPPAALGVKPATFMVVGGTRCTRYGKLAGEGTRLIKTHAMDYEIYRREASLNPETANIAVFIDNNLPFHRDYQLMGIDSPVEPNSYFASLRALFDRIENELGLEVVVAACPRGDYADAAKWFGPRRIEKMATGRLVARSRLVVTHPTTAINFAVLFRKPMLYVVTRGLHAHPNERPYVEGCARALGKPIQFFDDAAEVDLTNPFFVDGAVYDRYIAEYIKQPGSPDKPYWEIVLDAIGASGIVNLRPATRNAA